MVSAWILGYLCVGFALISVLTAFPYHNRHIETAGEFIGYWFFWPVVAVEVVYLLVCDIFGWWVNFLRGRND
jgi:uncharacterized membrane protein